MSRFGPSFTAANTRALRRRGLRGDTVVVVLTEEVLGLVGAEGGDAAIPFGQIAGLRAGFIQSRHGSGPELRVFLGDGTGMLHLVPARDRGDAAVASRSYPGLVRALAARLAASGRQDRIETGSGMLWAVFSTVLLCVPALAMSAVFAYTLLHPLPEFERWIARGVTGVAAIGLVALVPLYWRTTWPRRVRRPADLDRVLSRA